MEYEGDHAKVVQAVRESMGFHHNFDPKDQRAIFVFDVFADLLDLQVISTGIKILLGFIGLLTLGIGGVGLMNIMLVSVTQRTREIGVEKALGAHRWHILFQFLAEALVITALGGLLGVVLAYLVSWSVGSLDPVERVRRKRQRRRHPSLHRHRHADLVHGNPKLRRHHQRHAAGDQSRQAESDRSAALRVESNPVADRSVVVPRLQKINPSYRSPDIPSGVPV